MGAAFEDAGRELVQYQGGARAIPGLLRHAVRATGADAGVVSAAEGLGGRPVLRWAEGVPGRNGARSEWDGGSLLDPAAVAGGSVVFGDLRACPQGVLPAWVLRAGFGSVVALPLRTAGGAVGMLVLLSRASNRFGAQEVETAEPFAAALALVVESDELRRRLRAGCREEVRLLASLLHERDAYTGEHSARVMRYSRMLARSLGLGKAETERVGYAALLHDLGKIAIDNAVLHKPETLTGTEWRLIQCHPVVGAKILERSRYLRDLAPMVRNNHARFAGGGYPDPALRGGAIPLGSRILAVADAYEAMVSTRPYRKALPGSIALAELKRCAGTQFDPEIVAVFVKLVAA